jgi:hypothetical protein
MELHRFGIKLFAAEPADIRVKDFVPVFHSWIQRQAVEGHLLVDVHDYSNIQNGPGILLVAHEGNFCTDMAEGKLGLAYFRKQPAGENVESHLDAALKAARQAASLLEKETAFEGRLRFRKDELLVIANDRLLAPNDAATFATLKSPLAKVFGADAKLLHAGANPKDRLTVRVLGNPLS